MYPVSKIEATIRFELMIRVLQTHALPLGYVALNIKLVTPRGFEPLLPPWKGGVLTAWPWSLIKLIRMNRQVVLFYSYNSPSRTRTYDSAVNSRVLYRLSYRGKFPWRIAPSKLHIKYIISHLFCKVFSLHCLSMSFHPITFKDNSRSISLRFLTNLTSSVKPSTY